METVQTTGTLRVQYPMTAFHVAEKIPIKTAIEVVASLKLPPPEYVDPAGTDIIIRLPEPDAFCCVYSFGSLVFFNTPEERQKEIIEDIRTQFRPLDGELTNDDFSVIVDASQEERVSFDNAVLNDLAIAKIGILGLLLAQSATLEYYERVVEDLLDQAEAITATMKIDGKLPGYTRETIRYIGISLSTRRDIISRLYIVDAPDITWEDPSLDRLFKQMKATLDIDVRYRALEYKLKLIQEGVEVIVDLTNAQRNIWLEVIIVVLIFVEIILALVLGISH